MEYIGEYQHPAKGIMQTNDLNNCKSFKIGCECQSYDHAIDAYIEINSDRDTKNVECAFYITTWSPLFTRFFDRIRYAVSVLLTGQCKQEHTLLLNEQAAINFAGALTSSIENLKKE